MQNHLTLQRREAVMKYCSQCGGAVSLRTQERGGGPRYICESCRSIFYQSPRLVAGCIAEWEGKLLLCRRGTEPGYGLWTLPAGFLEYGEATDKGARREVLEEAGVQIEMGRLYAVFNIPMINQVQIVFLARLLDGNCTAGPETLEARMFDEHEIPWDRLAFTSTLESLRHYFQGRKSGEHSFLFADIVPLSR